jgi:hypothetical protein
VFIPVELVFPERRYINGQSVDERCWGLLVLKEMQVRTTSYLPG